MEDHVLGDVSRPLRGDEALSMWWSRLGGRPVWHQRPSVLDRPEILSCDLCGERLALVVQVAAGDTVFPQRTLYVFVCSATCAHDRRAWKAFRVAGPKLEACEPNDVSVSLAASPTNDSWSADMPVDDWGADMPVDDWALETSGAGALSLDDELASLIKAQESQHCAAGPSRSPQSYDACEEVGVMETAVPDAWQCRGLVMYAEPPKQEPGEHEQELLDRYLKSEQAEADGCSFERSGLSSDVLATIEQEESEMQVEENGMSDEATDDLDETLLQKFQQRLARSPKQILRHAWGGSPLWMSPPPSEVTDGLWPLPCRCGAPRKFELQLMPTILYTLHQTSQTRLSDDWGGAVVYTCAADCCEELCEEFMFLQDAL